MLRLKQRQASKICAVFPQQVMAICQWKCTELDHRLPRSVLRLPARHQCQGHGPTQLCLIARHRESMLQLKQSQAAKKCAVFPQQGMTTCHGKNKIRSHAFQDLCFVRARRVTMPRARPDRALACNSSQRKACCRVALATICGLFPLTMQ